MLTIVKDFWTASQHLRRCLGTAGPAVAAMHGVGIVSLGFVMDAIGEQYEELEPDVADSRATRLIAPACPWMGGILAIRPRQPQVERPAEHAP